uniref:Uncharacterized protein n=1 Tax=Tanacetum cinerariifolium TaxID=118510 RepID=A0A6L2MKV0_TANCI|nr:hypothetical protein [Tanacetum cinerariifolium]
MHRVSDIDTASESASPLICFRYFCWILNATLSSPFSYTHQLLLVTITTLPTLWFIECLLKFVSCPGYGNETRHELIGAVKIDADKPASEGALEMPKLHVTPEPEKSKECEVQLTQKFSFG